MSIRSEQFGNIRGLGFGRAAQTWRPRPEFYPVGSPQNPAPEPTRPGQTLPPSARQEKIRLAHRRILTRQEAVFDADLRRQELIAARNEKAAVIRADREAMDVYNAELEENNA